MKETRVRFNTDMKNKDKKKLTNMLLSDLGVREVIFNDDVIVVIVDDGTQIGSKGVSKRSSEDFYDPIIGFSIAYTLAKANQNGRKHYVKDRIEWAKDKGKITLNPKKRKSCLSLDATGMTFNGIHYGTIESGERFVGEKLKNYMKGV